MHCFHCGQCGHVDIKGYADMYSFGAWCLSAIGDDGYINIGGGKLVSQDYAAVDAYSAGTIRLNTTGTGVSMVAGNNDLMVEGNLRSTGQWVGAGSGGIINAAFINKDSYLAGIADSPVGEVNIALQNGALWTNQDGGFRYGDSSSFDATKESTVNNFYGGKDRASEGTIYQKQNGDITIKNYQGYSTICFDRDTKDLTKILGGDVIVNHVREVNGKGQYTTVTVRGSTAAQVGIFIDGVLANLGGDAAVDISTIPVKNVERIEVYRGYIPSRFAGTFMGGVINIVTKKPSGTQISAEMGKSSYGGAKGALEIISPLGNGSIMVGANYESSDGDFKYQNYAAERKVPEVQKSLNGFQASVDNFNINMVDTLTSSSGSSGSVIAITDSQKKYYQENTDAWLSFVRGTGENSLSGAIAENAYNVASKAKMNTFKNTMIEMGIKDKYIAAGYPETSSSPTKMDWWSAAYEDWTDNVESKIIINGDVSIKGEDNEQWGIPINSENVYSRFNNAGILTSVDKSSVTINGNVDFSVYGNGAATNAKDSKITISGGSIKVPTGTNYGYYTLASYQGTINMNTGSDGATPGTSAVKLDGDIFALSTGTVNLGLTTADSYLNGIVDNGGTVNMWLQNGATCK